MKHKKTGNYCPAFRFEDNIETMDKPGWIRFLLELGEPKNASKLEQLAPKDRTRIIKPERYKYILVIDNKKIWLKPGMWIVNTPDGYKVYHYGGHMLFHYEVMDEVPEVPITFNTEQMQIIRSLVSYILTSGTKLRGAEGSTVEEYKFFEENTTNITQKDWLYLITMLGLEEDIKKCTPKTPINIKPAEDFVTDYGKEELDHMKAARFAAHFGASSSKIGQILGDMVKGTKIHKAIEHVKTVQAQEEKPSNRYVLNSNKKVMQAVQLNADFINKILRNDLPKWVVDLLKNTNPRLPSLYWILSPQGTGNMHDCFRWRGCNENNSRQIPQDSWIVQNITYYPEIQRELVTTYVVSNAAFKKQFEKEKKSYNKFTKSELKRLFYDLEQEEYVIAFRLERKLFDGYFDEEPQIIQDLVNKQQFPTLAIHSEPLCDPKLPLRATMFWTRFRTNRVTEGCWISIPINDKKEPILDRVAVSSHDFFLQSFVKV